MATRTRIISSHIEDGEVNIKCYSDPAMGQQHVTNELDYRVADDLPRDVLRNLAALAFTMVAGNRFQRVKGHPDVPKVCDELYEEMKAGNWKPGRGRDAVDDEPSDLVKALAEATDTPTHVVQYQFDSGYLAKSQSQRPVEHDDPDIYRDAAGKPRKFFSKAMQASLKEDSAVKPIIARLEAERAKAALAASKGNKTPSKVAELFAHVAPADTDQNEAAE